MTINAKQRDEQLQRFMARDVARFVAGDTRAQRGGDNDREALPSYMLRTNCVRVYLNEAEHERFQALCKRENAEGSAVARACIAIVCAMADESDELRVYPKGAAKP